MRHLRGEKKVQLSFPYGVNYIGVFGYSRQLDPLKYLARIDENIWDAEQRRDGFGHGRLQLVRSSCG